MTLCRGSPSVEKEGRLTDQVAHFTRGMIIRRAVVILHVGRIQQQRQVMAAPGGLSIEDVSCVELPVIFG